MTRAMTRPLYHGLHLPSALIGVFFCSNIFCGMFLSGTHSLLLQYLVVFSAVCGSFFCGNLFCVGWDYNTESAQSRTSVLVASERNIAS
jgi:hypothetical protein